jgi:hypothetical protein
MTSANLEILDATNETDCVDKYLTQLMKQIVLMKLADYIMRYFNKQKQCCRIL